MFRRHERKYAKKTTLIQLLLSLALYIDFVLCDGCLALWCGWAMGWAKPVSIEMRDYRCEWVVDLAVWRLALWEGGRLGDGSTLDGGHVRLQASARAYAKACAPSSKRTQAQTSKCTYTLTRRVFGARNSLANE